jgi:medium-chain acyl-[acyl-carrier-protein] hydrolase
MGALLGFELIRVLQNNPAVTFNHLFVAASRAPHIQSSEPISNLPRTDLVSELRKLNGMPEELLSNEELLESILPTLRADLAACERYRIPSNCCIECPITAVGGEADVSVPCEHLYAWNRRTRAPFQAIVVPGDHFFLNTHRSLVVSIVAAIVERESQYGGTRVTGPTGIGQTVPQL